MSDIRSSQNGQMLFLLWRVFQSLNRKVSRAILLGPGQVNLDYVFKAKTLFDQLLIEACGLCCGMKDLEREELPPHMVRVTPAEIKRVCSDPILIVSGGCNNSLKRGSQSS